MGRSIVLLRGINVGGHNKVPMAELREALAAAGYEDVATYIQSGNVALSGRTPAVGDLQKLLQKHFGVDVPVVVVEQADIPTLAINNPFVGEVDDLSKLHVFFFASPIDPPAIELPDPERFAPDRWVFAERAAYVHYADGAGKTKLTLQVIEKAAGVTATARNMKTVQKLADL